MEYLETAIWWQILVALTNISSIYVVFQTPILMWRTWDSVRPLLGGKVITTLCIPNVDCFFFGFVWQALRHSFGTNFCTESNEHVKTILY